MKLPTRRRHGPIRGAPRTAGRDSGLTLARRASARGTSVSASMSSITPLRSLSFPFRSTSAGFSLPALPYRASFIIPPQLKPPEAGPNRLTGRSGHNKRSPRSFVNPGGSAPHELLTIRTRMTQNVKPEPLDLAPRAYYMGAIRVVGCTQSIACGAPEPQETPSFRGKAGRLELGIVDR